MQLHLVTIVLRQAKSTFLLSGLHTVNPLSKYMTWLFPECLYSKAFTTRWRYTTCYVLSCSKGSFTFSGAYQHYAIKQIDVYTV